MQKIVLLLALANLAASAKILGIFPMPAHSHFTVGFRLMKELADRGHQVTLISPFPQKTPVKNIRDISLAESTAVFLKKHHGDLIDIDQEYLVKVAPFIYSMGYTLTENVFGNEEVQKLLNSNESFDLVIMEQFQTEACTYFAHHFKAPLVLLSSVGSSSWTNHYVGNPAPLSHVPNMWMTHGAKMTFLQRIFNVFFTYYEKAFQYLVYFPKIDAILHKYQKESPSLEKLMGNVSLILLNSHPSVNEPLPHVPNMVEIGGYHVNPSGKLPDEIKTFLDGAKEGVVYFCMGSNLKTSQFPEEKKQAFLKTFARIKQKVLWKFEDDSLQNLPKNVKLVKWAPQQDILAYPNVKLFISHGGLLGSIEAVNFGVPVIGIPIFGDQKMNVATAVARGYALSVPFKDLTEEKLYDAVNKILTEESFSKNAKTRSKIMHDRVMKPIDEAVYWVEYAMRHPGATHFKSAAMELHWIQYYLLDVAVFVGLSILSVIISICYVWRKLLGQIKKSPQKKRKTN